MDFEIKAVKRDKSVVTQSCPALCNPMDCGLPGSSVHGIHQVRVLQWELSDPGIEPGSPALQADSLPNELQGNPEKRPRSAQMV